MDGSDPLSMTQGEEFHDSSTIMLAENAPAVQESQEDDPINQWGSLRSKYLPKEFKLMYRVKDNKRDIYTVGRGRSCDIILSDKRVSREHFQIYCDYSEPRMRVYVEARSAYGTFVNDSLTRLTEKQRIEIKSGDEIYVIDPRNTKAEDIISFMFINTRDRFVGKRSIALAPARNPETGTLRRHIDDFYIIGDQLGSGMCGQVHLCLHRQTKTQCAVKIIDTRRCPLGPGVSAKDLKNEAELMKSLNHVILTQYFPCSFEYDKIFLFSALYNTNPRLLRN